MQKVVEVDKAHYLRDFERNLTAEKYVYYWEAEEHERMILHQVREEVFHLVEQAVFVQGGEAGVSQDVATRRSGALQ